MTDDDQTTAREHGRAAGGNTGTFAGQCPYPHSGMALRTAWMDGFGEGREGIIAHEGEEQVAEKAQDHAGG